MGRTVILMMDSFGIGGAPDAGNSAMTEPTLSATLPPPVRT